MGYPGRTEPRAAGGSRRKARPGRRSPASPRPPRPSARSTLRRGRWRLRDSYLPTPRRALRDSTRRRSEACRATRQQHLGQRDADTDLVPSRPTTEGRRRRECFSLPHPLQGASSLRMRAAGVRAQAQGRAGSGRATLLPAGILRSDAVQRTLCCWPQEATHTTAQLTRRSGLHRPKPAADTVFHLQMLIPARAERQSPPYPSGCTSAFPTRCSLQSSCCLKSEAS